MPDVKGRHLALAPRSPTAGAALLPEIGTLTQQRLEIGEALAPALQFLGIRLRRHLAVGTEGGQAVSYTHLTLPTIYSV